jgi:hypothetical protein
MILRTVLRSVLPIMSKSSAGVVSAPVYWIHLYRLATVFDERTAPSQMFNRDCAARMLLA